MTPGDIREPGWLCLAMVVVLAATTFTMTSPGEDGHWIWLLGCAAGWFARQALNFFQMAYFANKARLSVHPSQEGPGQ